MAFNSILRIRRLEYSARKALKHISAFSSVSDLHSIPTPELIYERGDETLKLLKSGIIFSSFHTSYWVWYTTEFIPAVNASPMPELHIEPMLGYTGIAFALLTQGAFFLFPKCLVSKVERRPSGWIGERQVPAQLWIYTYSIPFIRPAAKASKVIDLAADLPPLADPAATEARQLLERGHMDGYTGRIPIKMSGQTIPFLLDMRSICTIPDSNRLFQALFSPGHLLQAPSSTKEEEDQFDDHPSNRRNFCRQRRAWKGPRPTRKRRR